MKLIRELYESVEYISESKDETGEKVHYIQGIFMQAEQVNKNGRIYKLPVMEAEVNRYTNEVIRNNRAYGELNHPSGPQINLDRVSHIITELKRDGNNYIGKARLTETPMGQIAIGLLKSGATLGVSSRGMGSLKPMKEGVMEVQDDFRLVTAADIVADPSAPNAFVKGIMEDVDWIYDSVKDTWIAENIHDAKYRLKRMTKEQRESVQLKLFENFLNKLTSK